MKTQVIILLFTLLLVMPGCENCKNDECIEPAKFRFQVLDNEGMILGSSAFFEDSIQVMGEIKKGEWKAISLSKYGTGMAFTLWRQIKKYIVSYSFADNDTLFFHIPKGRRGCCDHIVTDFTVEVNGALQPPSKNYIDYVFVKE